MSKLITKICFVFAIPSIFIGASAFASTNPKDCTYVNPFLKSDPRYHKGHTYFDFLGESLDNKFVAVRFFETTLGSKETQITCAIYDSTNGEVTEKLTLSSSQPKKKSSVENSWYELITRYRISQISRIQSFNNIKPSSNDGGGVYSVKGENIGIAAGQSGYFHFPNRVVDYNLDPAPTGRLVIAFQDKLIDTGKEVPQNCFDINKLYLLDETFILPVFYYQGDTRIYSRNDKYRRENTRMYLFFIEKS